MMIHNKKESTEMELNGDPNIMVSPVFIFATTSVLKIPRNPLTHSPIENAFSSNVTIFLSLQN